VLEEVKLRCPECRGKRTMLEVRNRQWHMTESAIRPGRIYVLKYEKTVAPV
jgi:hypothetical protein